MSPLMNVIGMIFTWLGFWFVLAWACDGLAWLIDKAPAAWRWLKGTKHPWVFRRVLRRPQDDEPYMIRYQFLITRWLVIYINKICMPDHDARVHTHPWKRAYSVKLRGRYVEHVATPAKAIIGDPLGRVIIGLPEDVCDVLVPIENQPGFVSRIPKAHRIVELIGGGPVWTLFVAFGNPRPWGFINTDGTIEPGPSAGGRS